MFSFKFVTFVFLFLLTQCCFANSLVNTFPSNNNSNSLTILSADQIKTDVDLLKKAYKRIHPGYTRYSPVDTIENSWDAIIEKANADQGMTLSEFYLRIQRTLNLIRCDHTKANLPKVMAEARKTENVYLPFRWQYIEGRAFVRIAKENSALSEFDEILKIDGTSIKTLIDEIVDYIPYDGLTVWSRRSGIAESLEFMGGALDHFGMLLWEIKPDVEITVRNKTGEEKHLTLPRINYVEWLALSKIKSNSSSKVPAANFKDAVSFKAINETTVYLNIDTFVNYRQPVEPSEIYDPVFKAIKEGGFSTLILDLRNNGGGSTDASQGLLANLIKTKMQFKLDMRVNTLEFEDIRPHLWTWDKRALDPSRIGFSSNDDGTYSLRSWFTEELDTIKPAKYAFTGRVIALTSNSNSSGSTNLLSVLKSAGRVTLVGEKTGGSSEGPNAGVLFTLTLPESNIKTRLPFFRYKNNVTGFAFGMGLIPDVEAPMTADALINGQDPALYQAIELAANNAKEK